MKSWRIWTLMAALLLVCGVAVPTYTTVRAAPTFDDISASGRTFYVAPDGSDSYPGTVARPWKTIGKAARTLDPGDVVYIQSGVYREGVNLDWRNSGTSTHPIAYRAYPGHRPIMDGATVGSASLGLFQMTGADHIEISGLTVRNSRVAGIHVRGGLGITIKDNRIERSKASGIGVWRSDVVIVDGNVLVDCRIDPRGANEMLTMGAVKDFQVSHNEIYWTDKDCCGVTAGIDVKQSSTRGTVFGNYLHDLPGNGIYVDAWDSPTYDLDVAGNYMHNMTTGISLGSERGGRLSDLRIYNNIIHHMKYCGIRIQNAGHDGAKEDIHIYHNTIVGSYGHGGAALLVGTYNVRDIVLTNNLLNFGPATYSGQIKAYKPSAITSVTNLVYGPKRAVSDSKLVEITQGTITADPRFVDGAHDNFHLRANSPARDRGSNIDLDWDYDGVHRPSGSGYDIGAYEYRVIGPMNNRAFVPLVVR